MRRNFNYMAIILLAFLLIMGAGCAQSSTPTATNDLNNAPVEHTGSPLQSTKETSLDSGRSQQDVNSGIPGDDRNTSEDTGPEIVDNLKSIEIENLNDKGNKKVVLDLPESWYAKELIFDKAPDFEYNAEKNKQIQKVYDFEFYSSTGTDKFNQYGIKRLAGEFDTLSYYRDQSERSRFPNHSEVKSRVYSGETVLGQGEIFVLNCDLPKEMRTDQYSTYDMIYAWIPINDEDLAYNLSFSVPLGEKDDGYIGMVKKMLSAEKQEADTTQKGSNSTPAIASVQNGNSAVIPSATDKKPEIDIQSPMTLSNSICTFKGQSAYLRLKMVKGRYYEDWNPGAYMGTLWEGSFVIELADESGRTIAETDISKMFSGPLTFKSSFNLEFDDYNNDGDPDFTIGQYASSNGRVYKLFTLRKDGKVEELPVKDHPDLFVSDTTGYYSTKLNKIDGTTFEIESYDNSVPATFHDSYQWDGKRFVLLKSQMTGEGLRDMQIPSLKDSNNANANIKS